MTPHVKWSIVGIVLGLILLIFSVVGDGGHRVLPIGIPAAAYLSLDPSQRRRYREIRRRKALR